MALAVGALVGHLQLDTRDWDRGLDTARSRVASMATGAAKVVGAGVMAAGAAAGGALSYSLWKGFGRLSSIDQAEKKLLGLGNSAETVERIMDNALASVRGTAFGMDAAASVAASTVAAGIEPGEDLEAVLKLVADASTIAGSSMEEMGAIFNKAATSNKVQGEILNQLGDRGIPIVQLLADHLGIAAGEVYELSRRGEIDFATFRAAMEAGLGGAAQSSGDTFVGAMANVQAAVGRIGANLLAGIFPQLAPALQDLQGWLGGLEEAAGPMGERLGEAFSAGLTGARELTTRYLPLVQWYLAVVKAEFHGARLAAVQFSDETRAKLEELLAPVGGLSGLFRTIGTEGQGAFDRVRTGATGLVEFLQTGTLNAAAAEALGPLATPEVLGGLLTIRDSIRDEVVPAFQGMWAEIQASAPGVGAVLVDVLAYGADLLGQRVQQLAPLVADVFGFIGSAVSGATEFWQKHSDWLLPTLGVIGKVLMWIGDTIIGSVIGMVRGLMGFLTGLGQTFSGIVDLIRGLVTGDWTMAWDGLRSIGEGALNMLVGAIQFAWNWGIFGFFKKGLRDLLGFFRTGWDDITRGVGNAMSGMWTNVTTWGGKVLGWFRDLPGKIAEFLLHLPQNLLAAGGNAAKSFLEGLAARVPVIGSLITDLVTGDAPSFGPGDGTGFDGGGGASSYRGGGGDTFYVTQNNPVATTDLEQISQARALAAMDGRV